MAARLANSGYFCDVHLDCPMMEFKLSVCISNGLSGRSLPSKPEESWEQVALHLQCG